LPPDPTITLTRDGQIVRLKVECAVPECGATLEIAFTSEPERDRENIDRYQNFLGDEFARHMGQRH
jgi:hypothetical protein